MRTVLAGDLGGTKCRFALVSEDFGVHAVQHVPTVRERGAFLTSLDAALTAILVPEIGVHRNRQHLPRCGLGLRKERYLLAPVAPKLLKHGGSVNGRRVVDHRLDLMLLKVGTELVAMGGTNHVVMEDRLLERW
jgi:hypothetical protein